MAEHIAIPDQHGRVLFLNRSWREFLRASDRHIFETSMGAHCLSSGVLGRARSGQIRTLSVALHKVLIGVSGGFRRTITMPVGDTARWYEFSASSLNDSGQRKILIARRDVSEARAASKVIARLSRRLVEVQEEERRRIAGELHDSTAQQLVAIGLHLIALRTRSENDPATLSAMQEIERMIDEAHRLPYEVQRTVLRTLREALSSAIRHAGATKIRVAVRIARKTVVLAALDNGHGMRGRSEYRNQVRSRSRIGPRRKACLQAAPILRPHVRSTVSGYALRKIRVFANFYGPSDLLRLGSAAFGWPPARRQPVGL